MRRKTVYGSVCVLLSLFIVLGVFLTFRNAHTLPPCNPFQAQAQITAAERRKTAESTAQTQTKADEEPSGQAYVSASESLAQADSQTWRQTQTAADSETQRSAETVTGFRNQAGILSAQTAAPSAFYGVETSAAVPVETAPQSTTQPQTAPAQAYTPPVFRTEETTTAAESEQQLPVIVTDLTDRLVTLSELTDGKLSFQAYLAGNTDGYSLRVYLHSAKQGTGQFLTAEGVWYRVPVTVDVYSVTLYLKNGDTIRDEKYFTVRVEADKASPQEPQVGDEPPVITTNLDDKTAAYKIQNSRFSFVVTAATAKGEPIYANGICVQLDGKDVPDPTRSGSAAYSYALYFEPPNVGEEETHTVTVLAWDSAGNSAFRSYTLTYCHVPEGERSGEVTVILDATTVGLGVLEQETVPLHQGENAAQILLRMLEDYGYTCEYQGNTKVGFYLRRIARGDMCKGAKVPQALWEMILRDGIVTNAAQHERDSLGEYDYTMGSGWMYSVNQTLYPGTGMENCYLNSGDVLTVSFTLARGKDIGGYDASAGGTGSLSGYCGMWRNGEFVPLEHSWEKKTDADGMPYYECGICHETKKEEDAA